MSGIRHPRLTQLIIHEDGSIIGPSGRVLKPFTDKNGYLRINTYVARKWAQHFVHVLVCETFHGERPSGMHAAHCDGDRLNPTADNLRWATAQENEADKVAHGTALQGERHHQARLTVLDVKTIRQERENGVLLSILAARFSVTESTISSIAKRKTWRHV